MAAQGKPDRTLDVRGMKYPLPILKAKKEIDVMKGGEILEILTTDRNSKPDLPIWARAIGADVLEVGEEAGVFRLVIRKP